jgi:hypothetical protein
MKLPWDKDDHEKIDERLDELEEKAADAEVRLLRLEAELGIAKPPILVRPQNRAA